MTQSSNRAGRSVGCGCLSVVLVALLAGVGLLAFLTPVNGSGSMAGVGLVFVLLVLIVISGAIRTIRRWQPTIEAGPEDEGSPAPESMDRPTRTSAPPPPSRSMRAPVEPVARTRPSRDQAPRRGWYPDPDDAHGDWLRWWDGESWTDHVREV